MKRFVFTLQALLQVRQSQEKEIKSEMAVLEGRIQALVRQHDDLARQQAALQHQRSRQLQQGISATWLQQYQGSFEQLSSQMKTVRQETAQLEAEKERCLDRLKSVKSDIRSLEILQERQHEAYLREAAREHAREVDEFIVSRQVQAFGTEGSVP